MRFLKTALPLLLVVVISADSAFAGGGFLQKLPKDGTWVKYNMEMKAEKGPMQEMTGTMMLKSVGEVTENGEACRWLEIEFKGEQNGMKAHTVIKALIREKDLKPGVKTGVGVLRGWQQNQIGDNKMDPKELAEFERAKNGHAGFLLRSELKKERSIKRAKTIDYQKGQLKLEAARTGVADIKLAENTPADLKYLAKQTVWHHKSIPTGVAAIEIGIEIRRKDEVVMKMNMKFSVQDYGKDAKSALPDKK